MSVLLLNWSAVLGPYGYGATGQTVSDTVMPIVGKDQIHILIYTIVYTMPYTIIYPMIYIMVYIIEYGMVSTMVYIMICI